MWPLSITIIVTFLITSILANHYQTTDDKQEKINLRKLVTEINSDPKSLWKADTYGFDEIHASDVKQKLGLKLRLEDKSPSQKPLKLKASIRNEPKLGAGTALPKFYDARQRYPNCSSISHIRDQSYCGSCWAVSGASVFSDRLCIHSKGKYTGELSSRFILSCDKDNYGCNGGYLDTMWDFLGVYGTVTGGEFQSDEGCQPYPLHPCGWPRKLACPWYLTPKCIKNKCDNEMYQYPREPRNYKVKESYSVGDPYGIFSEVMIQDEIYQNGPVQAGFYVYADFMTYKSGIYHRTRRSRFLGGHAVKIIGWGVEKGVKYWLIANSWGEEWGEKGTFRMLRGENECGIEDEVYAGIPNI